MAERNIHPEHMQYGFYRITHNTQEMQNLRMRRNYLPDNTIYVQTMAFVILRRIYDGENKF